MVAPEDDLIPNLPWSGTDLVYIVADVPLDIRVEEYFHLLQQNTKASLVADPGRASNYTMGQKRALQQQQLFTARKGWFVLTRMRHHRCVIVNRPWQVVKCSTRASPATAGARPTGRGINLLHMGPLSRPSAEHAAHRCEVCAHLPTNSWASFTHKTGPQIQVTPLTFRNKVIR